MTTEDRILQNMTIGKLRTRITIRVPSVQKDSRGNNILSYADGDTVWGCVETHASQMYETTGEVNIIRKVIIIMRYRSDLTPDHQFRAAGRLYRQVGSPLDAGMRHQWNYMECVEDVQT